MFVGDTCVGNADEVCPGIVVAVAGPETSAGSLVGEIAVVILEPGENGVETCGILEGRRFLVCKGVLEILLRREHPSGGAYGARGRGVCVEASVRIAVVVVVAVADAGIGSKNVQVFCHPDLSSQIHGLVSFLGADERVFAFVVGAFTVVSAGVKGDCGGQGECCDCEFLEKLIHK